MADPELGERPSCGNGANLRYGSDSGMWVEWFERAQNVWLHVVLRFFQPGSPRALARTGERKHAKEPRSCLSVFLADRDHCHSEGNETCFFNVG